MRYIDAFNHFFPKRYYDALLETPAAPRTSASACAAFRRCPTSICGCAWSSSSTNYTQVLSHGLPPIERLFRPGQVARDGEDRQ